MAEYPDDEELTEPIDGEEAPAPRRKNNAAEKLLKFLDSPNLVKDLTDEQLAKIGTQAIEGYKRDDASREDWKKLNAAGMKLATLVTEQKDTPFVGAANVKAPPVALSRERPSSAAAATEPSTSSSSSVKASHDPRLIKTTRKGMKFQREVQAQLREARTVRRCRLNTTG